MPSPHPRITLDCYVRASGGIQPVAGIIEQLYGYDERGVIDELTVQIWPKEINLTIGTEGTPVLDQYDRFQRWATDCGVSLEPAFTRRERTTLVSDDPDTVLVFPVLCLAIHVDGELVAVAPHSTDTATYTVGDALADIVSLSRGTPSEDVSEPFHSGATTQVSEEVPSVQPKRSP